MRLINMAYRQILYYLSIYTQIDDIVFFNIIEGEQFF